MINKIFSFLIRGGVTCALGFAVGVPLDSLPPAIFIWVVGGIYTLVTINDSYNIPGLTSAENKIIGSIDENRKKKIAADMLTIKNLYDKDILTQDEYDKKIQVLKDQYL